MLDDTKLALFSPNALAYLSPIYGYLEGVSSAVVTEARNGAYELEVVCWPGAGAHPPSQGKAGDRSGQPQTAQGGMGEGL